MTYRTFRQDLITTVEIGNLDNYCSLKVFHETRTLGISVIGDLDNETKRQAFWKIKKLLKELQETFHAYVKQTDRRANKFVKYLGFDLENQILGYNKYCYDIGANKI